MRLDPWRDRLPMSLSWANGSVDASRNDCTGDHKDREEGRKPERGEKNP